MIMIALEKAEKDLGRLIDQVKAGGEVVITQSNEPVARLVAVARASAPRVPGSMKGQLDLPDSFFFDPLQESDLQLWSGDGEQRP